MPSCTLSPTPPGGLVSGLSCAVPNVNWTADELGIGIDGARASEDSGALIALRLCVGERAGEGAEVPGAVGRGHR